MRDFDEGCEVFVCFGTDFYFAVCWGEFVQVYSEFYAVLSAVWFYVVVEVDYVRLAYAVEEVYLGDLSGFFGFYWDCEG